MKFSNVYQDAQRALSYASLEFPGTYYLAYRDLPKIIAKHVIGHKSLDFGCGTGRSTRFLKQLGFDSIGLDIAPDMVEMAIKLDPDGDYRLLNEKGFQGFDQGSFDLITAVFTFDNIAIQANKLTIFKQLCQWLSANGTIVNLVSAPEIYVNEWLSFSTIGFAKNRTAKSGDKVKIVMKDVPDKRPVEDILCSDEDYRKIYLQAGLKVVAIYKPLGRVEEAIAWVNEIKIPPWVIYVLKKK